MSTITASQEQQVVERVPKQLYIAGEWRDGAKGTFEVEDPSTGTALCEVADASVDDAKSALDAAVDAFPGFAAMAPRRRSLSSPPISIGCWTRTQRCSKA